MKMSRLLKALPAMLALAAIGVVTVSCGANAPAVIRVVNAIPDGTPVDIYVNGAKIITNLPFTTVQPNTSPATYLSVTAGSATIQGFATGTTINPVPPEGVISLTGSTQYTVVAVGLEFNDSAPLVLADNNTAPSSGNVEIRIINASQSSPPGGVDVYIVPPNVTDLTNYTPQISALGSQQSSPYLSPVFTATGYSVVVTANGSKMALITQLFTRPSGSITTYVLVDNAGGKNGISQTPLVLNDLN